MSLDDLDWLKTHAERHGRPLRVLHVGNIANNAYLNAKFLRSMGIDAHVLSYDYYHVMAMPEWEELELRDNHGDDYRPRFSPRDLGSYRRPLWFVNAPLVSSPALIADLCGERASPLRRVASFTLREAVQFVSELHPKLGRALQLFITNRPIFFFHLSRKLEEYF